MALLGVALSERAPQLVGEWHPKMNGRLRPDGITGRSEQKVWWRCARNPTHEWQATPASRVYGGSGCPLCGRLRGTATTSLAALHPELAREWHPTKNGMLVPSDVRPASKHKVWWRCANDARHEWSSAIASRVYKRSGCPKCPGGRARSASLLDRFPKLAKEWHPTKNGKLKPEDVLTSSFDVVWWKCPNGPDHEWTTQVRTRSQLKTGCPFCSGRRPSATHSLAYFFPKLAKEWHPKKNGELAPTEVTPGSTRNVWWRCLKDPRHEWRSIVRSRTSKHHPGLCPYCGPHKRYLHPTTALATLRPDLAQQWHPTKNGDLRPSDVTTGAHVRVWWRCAEDPTHEWPAVVSNRHRGASCPFCGNYRASRATSLAALRPDLAKQWHKKKNGGLKPSDVTPGSSKRVWWKCPAGIDHEWQAIVSNRNKRKIVVCPFCTGRRRSA